MNPAPEITDYEEIAEKFVPTADHMPGNALYERPATIALLPPLKGLDVLDAGCGNGFYCELAAREGARVVGFDPSGKMVQAARQRVGRKCELHHCTTAELEALIGGRRFDLILSCLVMHYVADIETEFALLAGLLKPGGKMIVSTKHPFIHGQYIDKHGYRTIGLVEVPWSIAVMRHIHRPLSAFSAAFRKAGLLIEDIVEAEPLPETRETLPRFFAQAMQIPFFIHFVLKKA